MNPVKIIIPKTLSLFEAIKLIESSIKDVSVPLIIDMSDVGFPLTRDVFFVLAKRFRTDQYRLLLRHEHQVEMARSASITAVLSGISAEFDRAYEPKNILKHNFTMWEYFLYELKR